MASDDDGLAGLEQTARRRPRRRGRAILGFFALLIIAAFVAVIRIAYDEGIREGKDLAPPLVRAKDGPVKVIPEEPGGMKVPNQDKQVFATLEPRAAPGQVEELLPPPEMPAPEQPAAASAQSETAAATPPKPPEPIPTADDPPPVAEPQGVAVAAAPPTPPPVKNRPAAAQPAPPPAAAASDDANAENAAPPAAEPPEKATTVALAGAHRIQLGSFRTEKDAERAWGIFKGRHPEQLARLAPLIVRAELAGGSKVFYRVQAGPFGDRTSATAVCNQLKAKKQGCLVVAP